MSVIKGFIAVCIGFSLTTAAAGDVPQQGDRQDWKLGKATRLAGETCEEDKSLQPPNNPKCATLTADGDYLTVSEFLVRFPSRHPHSGADKPKTVHVEACLKFEDTATNGAKCQTLIDSVVAQPGESSMNVENSGLVPVTDYLSCMAWFGQTGGKFRATIQVQCKNDKKGDAMTEVDVSRFTTSVWSQY